MIHIQRTSPKNEDFKQLIISLDKDLAFSDGDEHGFYNQFNGVENILHAVIVYVDDIPASCGAIKEYTSTTMEVKRMFTTGAFRRKGLASKTLTALETWAKELGYKKCILETGKRQPNAIALYRDTGYTAISNYGQYVGKENSVCFEKYF